MEASKAVFPLFSDSDRILVLLLLVILYRQEADKSLLFALLYIAMF